jgi:pimeloyl-ACP methyl ester carboxylesterase
MRRLRGLAAGTAGCLVAVLGLAGPGFAAGNDAAAGNERVPAPSWGACPPLEPGAERDPRQQCTALSMPLDYRRPGGRQITVTISRIPAGNPGVRHGILLANPGGPGGSGLDLPSYLAGALPAEVSDRFDLIGFDPRGVGASTPITCGLPAGTPNEALLPYPAPDGSIAGNVEFARTTARSCAAHSGDLLPYITTANTARDMDRIRVALGEPRLSYLGYSYGTYMGAVYTSLFPKRSDRMVLDSAIDPNRIWYDFWRTWNTAVALRLPDFTAWAAARDGTYHLGASAKAVERTYFALANTLDANPWNPPDPGTGPVTGNTFREITRSYLYDDRFFPALAEIWQFLTEQPAQQQVSEALSTALRAPQALTPWAVRQAASVPIDNEISVAYAIVCDDVAWPRDVSTYRRNVAADRRAWPITAGMPSNVWPCTFWPSRPVEPPVAVTAEGPRNVLILQNLRDPATSWLSGHGMRVALGARAAMVSIDAGGHGVYAIRSGPCTDAIATAFLTTGALPDRDRFCAGPSPED